MIYLNVTLNQLFATCAIFYATFAALPALADDRQALLEALKSAGPEAAQATADELVARWARSGSPAMDALFARGMADLEAGCPLCALEHFNAVTDHGPEFAQGWLARARGYYAIGELGQAILDLEQAIALNPQNFEAYALLGEAFEALDRVDAAEQAYLKGANIHPTGARLVAGLQRLENRREGVAL